MIFAMVRKHIPGLDGLRAASICLVVVGHASTCPGFPRAWGEFTCAALGVDIFFAISGFLITTLLLEDESRFGKIRLTTFYSRRIYRILPAALTFLLCMAALRAIVPAFPSSSRDLVVTALFAANYFHVSPIVGHYWSLAIEEQFYLIWPALLILVPRRHMLPAVAAWLVFSPFWHQLNLKMFGAPTVNVGRLDLCADRLCVGVALALAAPTHRGQELLGWIGRRGGFVFIVAILGLLARHELSRLSLRPGVSWLATVYLRDVSIAALLLSAMSGRAGFATRLLDIGAVRRLGSLSYSLYLWQQPFLWTPIWKGVFHYFNLFPISVALALAVASVSYYCVERPFLRLRDRRMAVGAPTAALSAPRA
jgi:peptidoglycan/LPS O-acetylase OafA/YrhL